jgi:hypothetical protein
MSYYYDKNVPIQDPVSPSYRDYLLSSNLNDNNLNADYIDGGTKTANFIPSYGGPKYNVSLNFNITPDPQIDIDWATTEVVIKSYEPELIYVNIYKAVPYNNDNLVARISGFDIIATKTVYGTYTNGTNTYINDGVGFGAYNLTFYTYNPVFKAYQGSKELTAEFFVGSNLLPNTKYLIEIEVSSKSYKNSKNSDPIFTTMPTQEYTWNERTIRNYPSYFITPPLAPAEPPTIRPTVNNGYRTNGLDTPDYSVQTTESTATLKSNYYYSQQPINKDSPASVTFAWRKSGTNSWTYTNSLPTTLTTYGTSGVVNEQFTITGLDVATKYEYTSYVTDKSDLKFFSSNSGIVTSIGAALPTPFTTKSKTISSWQNPNPNTKGHWFQLYNDWELISSATPPTNKVAPFLRVRKYVEDTTDTKEEHSNLDQEFSIFYFLNKVFIKDKNYQFRTIVENFYTYKDNTNTSGKNSKFKIKTPWGEPFDLTNTIPYFPLASIPDSLKVINLYLYTNINSFDNTSGITKEKPIELIESKTNPQNPITYNANSYFTGADYKNYAIPNTSNSLLDLNISDIDWIIQGYAPFNISDYSGTGALQINKDEVIPVFISGDPIGGKGWHFLENKGSFIWFDKYNKFDLVENTKNLPIGGEVNNYYYGKESNEKYLVNNFIAKYISYQTFNISFDYTNSTKFKLSMYVGGSLPSFQDNKYNLDQLITDGYIKKIYTFGSSNGTIPGTTQSCEFIGVDGNQYLFFIADPVYSHIDENNKIIVTNKYLSTFDTAALTVTSYSLITLSNFKVSGSYNDQNNKNFNISTTQSYSTIHPIANATYSIKLGIGNNVIPNSVTSSVTTVNSLAGNGRFNSGIWENGVWNNGWREDLTRRDFYKIDQFYSYEKDKKWRVKISGNATQSFIIGDKVSISNIVAIDINEERKLLKKYYTIVDIGSNYVEVEFENDFPLRRIEMDSDEHRIYISKNVWLSGVFLNGYFKGIWNSGLFSGYPLITKMDESHWIDGIFNGGHFTSNKYKTTFSSVFPSDLNGVTRLGLSFSTPHNLAVDDIISVTPNTYFVNNVAQNNSLGTTIVSEVINDYQLTTGISWKTDYIDIKNGGKINSIISTGLIQNFDFYSNNVSTITSLQSLRSERVFSYNSWIDVNYSNQSAVNIGKPQSILEGDTKRSYSENNLYGYPTNDVLSSNSVFRDSFSTSFRKYKLGKKFKIFNDYVGDSSSFEEYFDSSDTSVGIEAFNTQGWDISVNSSDTNIKLNAKSVIWTGQFSDYSTNLVTIEFDGDVTYIPNVVTINGTLGNSRRVSGVEFPRTNSPYISSATKSNINYNNLTNLTSVSFVTEIPVYDIVGSTKNLYLDYDLKFLDRDTSTYVTFNIRDGLTFSRTPEPLNSNSPTIGKELKINASKRGGYLNLIPAYDVLNRTNGTDTQTLEKTRYTMVEFDLVDYVSATNSYLDTNGYKQPSIHFNNLNYITRNVIGASGTQSLTLPATYLPISKNINHLLTRSKKKQEFFFNKRNLLMNFKGTGLFGKYDAEYYLDNIKFYQINMIPFFQYFISPIGAQGNINKSVQIPITGTSPIIDYTEDNIIDSNNDNNDIITFFSNSLIASNIEIPAGINWERDYSIYRTQISGNDILGNDDLYLEN